MNKNPFDKVHKYENTLNCGRQRAQYMGRDLYSDEIETLIDIESKSYWGKIKKYMYKVDYLKV